MRVREGDRLYEPKTGITLVITEITGTTKPVKCYDERLPSEERLFPSYMGMWSGVNKGRYKLIPKSNLPEDLFEI